MRVPRSIDWAKGPASRPGSVIDSFVVSIDVAPTFLEVAGAPPARDIDGRSLVPLLRGDGVDWREAFLIEYFSDRVFPRIANMGYQAVRTDRWCYIHYVDLEGMDELYDLHDDPYQMKNLIADPSAQPALQQLKGELERLLRDSR
jgi:N-acetylglucosamine-6-sulfatase